MHDVFENGEQLGLLLRRKVTKELTIVLIRTFCQNRYELSPRGGQPNDLVTPIRSLGSTMDQIFGDEPIEQLRDRSACQADFIGDAAGIQPLGIKEGPHDDPFRDGDAARLKLEPEGV